jgi:cytochrome c
MKKLFVILSCSLLAIACGSGDSSKSSGKDSAAAAPAGGSGAVTATDEKGLELIGASDCTTCHRLNASTQGVSTGPAYSEVAAKYAPAADSTVNRIVQKIITGGSGIWGSVPMTPHPQLAEADIREMVKYILSLKK